MTDPAATNRLWQKNATASATPAKAAHVDENEAAATEATHDGEHEAPDAAAATATRGDGAADAALLLLPLPPLIYALVCLCYAHAAYKSIFCFSK